MNFAVLRITIMMIKYSIVVVGDVIGVGACVL